MKIKIKEGDLRRIKHTADAPLLTRLMAVNIGMTTPVIRPETTAKTFLTFVAFVTLIGGLGLIYAIFS
jgi:hypothetical protein